RVPRRNLIGADCQGFTYQMLQFQEERLYGAAAARVVLDRSIDETIDYTRARKIFGRPVRDHQVVHYRLAELKTEVEARRALTYRATELYVQGGDVT
ncbi:acyl-CoA dehydrogenase family protein, partial [Burkholderia pseudomallei]